MSNFLLNNSPDFYLNVETDFIYNFYNENETQTDDSIFLNNNINFYKSIKINVQARSKYDKRLFSFYENLNTKDIKLFKNKNLNENTLFYFNRVHKLNENLINLNYDTDIESINEINSFYNISDEKFKIAKDFIETNKKISVSKNFEKEFINLNHFNEFFTESNFENYNFYKKNIDKTSNSSSKLIDKLIINENFNVYRKKSIYSSKNVSKSYYINIGFLIEKYVKNQNSYEKLSSYFKYNDQNESIPSLNKVSEDHTIKYNFSLNDNGIKYGKTYKYVIYPVYIASLPSRMDYHLIDEFIVCGFPYITNDVECKENVRPIPPSQISFKFINSKDFLKISWSKPLEEQGDVKGYQIFKRHSLEDPFVLIKQLEFHNENDFYTRNEKVSQTIIENMKKENNTFFYDKNFKKEKIQIYAICSIDAHGFISNYSAQYAVKYNHYNKKCEIDLISTEGSPLHMPNLMLPRRTKFYENEDYIVNNMPIEKKVKKFTLYVTPEYNKLGAGTEVYKTVLGDKYKLSIFKLENSDVYTEDINILNFNVENFI